MRTVMLARLVSLGLALSGGLAVIGCDDKPAAGDRKSVQDGGKPESAAGKQVENAKLKIGAAEQRLQDRDDEIFEKSGGEKVERGLP